MKIWRLVVLGKELIRTERFEDADKSMVQAIEELIDSDDVYLEDDLELRVAGDDEHVVFTADDED